VNVENADRDIELRTRHLTDLYKDLSSAITSFVTLDCVLKFNKAIHACRHALDQATNRWLRYSSLKNGSLFHVEGSQ